MSEHHATDAELRVIVDGESAGVVSEKHIDGCESCSLRLAREAATVLLARTLSTPERTRATTKARKADPRFVRASVPALVMAFVAGIVVLGATPANSSPVAHSSEEVAGGTPEYLGGQQIALQPRTIQVAVLDAGAPAPARAQ